jgi:outer membrane protein OmpA-like peptidoglycan-associated protein
VFSLLTMVALGMQEPAARPPVPPMPTIVHGYIYFDENSTVVGGIYPQVVTVMVRRLRDSASYYPDGYYAYVRGQTDTVGSDEANLRLSRRRALVVAELAIREGVDPNRLQIISCGETLLNRPTPDNVSEPLNRFAKFDWEGRPLANVGGCTLETYAEARARQS